MTAVYPVRDASALAEDRQRGLARWREDVDARLAACERAAHDRQSQQDARRERVVLEHTRAAVSACLARRLRTRDEASDTQPRAVVAHRSGWVRARLVEEFATLGVRVVGACDDGAEALALAVVEQPELLLLEDKLPWLATLAVVEGARDLAPHTAVAVQIEDAGEAESMLGAGAAAVFSRAVRPDQLCECCVDVLVSEALARPA